ncbi:DUF177 domain-containing protein [bacterium]|nr:DUF177 domain-containing protein [candidate division CSSED10-310 bacterium]
MLQRSLHAIPENGQELAFEVAADQLEWREEEYDVSGPVTCRMYLERREDEVRINGHLTAMLGARCSRCLERAEISVQDDFEYEFSLRDAVVDELDPLIAQAVATGMIDLAQMIHERLLLNIPLRVICTPGCKGLCPICGGNRNKVACTCETPEGDPRFQVLRRLKLDTK